MIFTYQSKGSHDEFTEDFIEAENEAEAVAKLDDIYGVVRDAKGNQTEKSKKMIQFEILSPKQGTAPK